MAIRSGQLHSGNTSKNMLPNVGERSNSSTNRSVRAPKLSLQRTKSFDQQVKRLIAESIHGNSKAALGKQLLQDQQTMRSSFDQPKKSRPRTPSQMGFTPHLNLHEKSSFVANAVTRFIQGASQKPPTSVFRPHYTEFGRKLHDTSIQAVLTDQKGQEESVTNLSILSRRLRKIPRYGRMASPSLGGRLVGTRSMERSYKATTSMALPSTIQPQRSTSRSKSNFLEGSKIHPEARKTNGSNAGSQIMIPNELSKESSNRLKPFIDGSLQACAGSLYKPQSSLKITPEGSLKNRQLTNSKLELEESTKNSVDVTSPDEKSKKVIVTKMHSVPGIQHSSRSFQPVRSSFRGEYSSLRGKKNSKEPLLRADHRQSLLSKSKKGSYQKSESKSTSPGPMRPSADESKPVTIQPRESMLKEMLKYCRCPDSEVSGEVEMPEVEIDVDFFRQSTENVSDKRSKIKSVTRSPFERKDRAARAAFAKELEQIEIAEIEKKQRLKPRRIKKELKKGGVYETVKSICHVPESFTDSLRGHPSCPSNMTGASPPVSRSPTRSETDGSRSGSSSEDKLQLRKDTSMGSRTTPGRVTKDDAFHEIELSEDSETSYNKVSMGTSSPTSSELISSSSEISLRVNLEKICSPNGRKRKKNINAPFVNYQNKINAELILAESKKSKTKILDTNLEGVIIEKIATEFGEWAKENGVKPEAVEKDVIKELFQFGTMDTAANSIAVEIKELIIVPDSITGGIYPELEERAAMYRQILFDECAYWRTERSMAFGKPDPKPYKRPPNPPLPAWTKSGFVPQPLATGEQLYQTLIDNDSTMLERYVLWMVENPRHYRSPYLLKCGYFQKVVDKHGGSEEAIRHKNAAMKLLSSNAGKNMAGLNIGMQSDLRKLKEMSEAGKKPKAQQ